MKKIAVIFLTLLTFTSFGCVSTSSTFGEASSTSSNDVKIFTDKFSGKKTYEYTKGLRGGFALSRGFSADYLEVCPHLIVTEDNICTPFLEINYIGASGPMLNTGADKTYKKFIFLGNNERLEIEPVVNPNKEKTTKVGVTSGYIYNTSDYSGNYSMHITKEQFDILKNLIFIL